MSTTREDLEKTLGEVEWSLIRPHLDRGVVITVSDQLDLLTVAERIAADDTDQVSRWLKSGLLGKPSASDIESWNQNPSRTVRSIVVQPYVLIQQLLLN